MVAPGLGLGVQALAWAVPRLQGLLSVELRLAVSLWVVQRLLLAVRRLVGSGLPEPRSVPPLAQRLAEV